MILEAIEPIQDNLELMFYWGQDFSALAADSYQEGMAKIIQVCFDEALFDPCFAIEGNSAVGFVYFRYANENLPAEIPEACALFVLIAPEYRQKGYSHTLIALATELAHQQGWQYVLAEVPKPDKNLARVFLGLGFERLEENTPSHMRLIHRA